MTSVVIRALRGAYQIIRPVFGPPCCRFEPSCSKFAEEAVTTLGLFAALPRILGRLLRCHPFNPGGYDPVRPVSHG